MGTYIEKPKKAPLKTEFIVQLKALEKEHEALKLENIKNLEKIHELESKVATLEKDVKKQAGAELCQAQGKLKLVWL